MNKRGHHPSLSRWSNVAYRSFRFSGTIFSMCMKLFRRPWMIRHVGFAAAYFVCLVFTARLLDPLPRLRIPAVEKQSVLDVSPDGRWLLTTNQIAGLDDDQQES